MNTTPCILKQSINLMCIVKREFNGVSTWLLWIKICLCCDSK